ncbi:hypothetical protein [Azohydromonas lata]|uniref:Uncharacterized protein n=1 Tax=Azohydromonas lata TaxID=45677 RepID=A0ABU5I7B8_9BURK|nr:hypothetical protein [Azohydromonas lata]MDZ5454991.1 hypothetical protein [Azohydromonas lata]
MEAAMNASKRDASRAAFSPVFSIDECRRIARAYDGSPQSIDRLLTQWSAQKPGLKRRHITRAAQRGGYRPDIARRRWTESENAWLLQHWSSLSDTELAAALGRPAGAIQQHYRRLRSTVASPAERTFSLGALRRLTGVDPREWRDFIRRGWLESGGGPRDRKAGRAVQVSAEAVLALLQAHPEVLNYERATDEARLALNLARLPAPPRFKRVTCRSRPCRQQGGTAFWAPIYAAPRCPRCGRLTSRLSTLAQYRVQAENAAESAAADRSP